MSKYPFDYDGDYEVNPWPLAIALSLVLWALIAAAVKFVPVLFG